MTVAAAASPDAVTPEWVTDVLLSAGAVLPGARVSGLRSERIGDGKIGCNVRVLLEWSSGAAAGPRSVVVKLPAEDMASRMTGVGLGLYVKEVGFYRELAAQVGCRVPVCYGTYLDPVTGEFALLLEDLAPASAGDQLAGCSVAEAELAVDELARLHASCWERPMPDWLPPGMAESAGGVGVIYGGLVEGFVEKYRGELTDEVLAVVAEFGASFESWGRVASGGPRSVVHGDFRLDNLLFGAPGPEGGSEPRVAVVDWQTVAQASPMSDLAYFVGAGLRPETRRAHEGALVDRYLARLRGLGVEPPPWSELEPVYRAQTLGGLIMAVLPAMLVAEDTRSRAMFATMAERHALHAIDRGALDLVRGR